MNQWIGVLGSAVLIAAFIFLLRKSGDSAEPAEKELFRLCCGDREMMDRLISYELNRGKRDDRKAAIRAAINSLKRDNR